MNGQNDNANLEWNARIRCRVCNTIVDVDGAVGAFNHGWTVLHASAFIDPRDRIAWTGVCRCCKKRPLVRIGCGDTAREIPEPPPPPPNVSVATGATLPRVRRSWLDWIAGRFHRETAVSDAVVDGVARDIGLDK